MSDGFEECNVVLVSMFDFRVEVRVVVFGVVSVASRWIEDGEGWIEEA